MSCFVLFCFSKGSRHRNRNSKKLVLHGYVFVLVAAAAYSWTRSGTSDEGLGRTAWAEGQPLHVLLGHWQHRVTAAVEVWALPGMCRCNKRPHSEAFLESLELWCLCDHWMPCRCMSVIYIPIPRLASSHSLLWCEVMYGISCAAFGSTLSSVQG